MWKTYKCKKYYEKQVMLREVTNGRGEGRVKVKKLMYSLYKNEYRIFKPIEITIKRELGRKEKNREDEPV
jgi:hypothetical protein